MGMTRRRSDKQHGKNGPGVRSCGGKGVPPKSATSFQAGRTGRARRAGDERRLPLTLGTGAQHTFPWAETLLGFLGDSLYFIIVF